MVSVAGGLAVALTGVMGDMAGGTGISREACGTAAAAIRGSRGECGRWVCLGRVNIPAKSTVLICYSKLLAKLLVVIPVTGT